MLRSVLFGFPMVSEVLVGGYISLSLLKFINDFSNGRKQNVKTDVHQKINVHRFILFSIVSIVFFVGRNHLVFNCVYHIDNDETVKFFKIQETIAYLVVYKWFH